MKSKIDLFYLKPAEIELGFNVEADSQNNIFLLKFGREIARFSTGADNRVVRAFVRLIVLSDRQEPTGDTPVMASRQTKGG